MNHTAFYFNPEMTNSKTKRGLLSLLIITSACIPFAMHMMQFYWENPPPTKQLSQFYRYRMMDKEPMKIHFIRFRSPL